MHILPCSRPSTAETFFVFFVFLIENGEFLSLDLGGSKFRVLKVQVSEEGKQKVQMESQFYPTPNEIICGNGTEVPGGALGVEEAPRFEWPHSVQRPLLSLRHSCSNTWPTAWPIS